jgi:UDP-3-O-[3-hydroxymyristoyl] glucosamine N-acyltransferase
MLRERFFKKSDPLKLSDIAELINAKLIGDGNTIINDIATLDLANENCLSFLNNKKYLPSYKTSKAIACIISEDNAIHAPKGMNLLISDNPYAAWAKVVARFYNNDAIDYKIAASAKICKSAQLHKKCSIGENAFIGEGVEISSGVVIGANTVIMNGVIIGENTQIRSGSVISHAVIGNGCLIHPGVKIGQDGFGFAPTNSGIMKVEQVGIVEIGNHVEIGSNTCIDRGAIENTIIGDGTKIDNLVQVGHGAKVGRSCFIVAQVAIAGSTTIGDGVMIGGQAAIAGHLNVGNRAMIAGQSGVIADVKPGEVLGGTPALPIKQWHRITAMLKKMTNRDKKVGENE